MASRFLGFCVFQVFQDFCATFFIMILVREGGSFFDFKGKIIFGDAPLASNSDPPMRENLLPKTPQMGGTPGFFFFLLFFLRFFIF